jgi:hypothetical protein
LSGSEASPDADDAVAFSCLTSNGEIDFRDVFLAGYKIYVYHHQLNMYLAMIIENDQLAGICRALLVRLGKAFNSLEDLPRPPCQKGGTAEPGAATDRGPSSDS